MDKDKIRKIKEEIEKRLSNLWYLIPEGEKVLQDNFTKEDANNLGKYTALESILEFIDSLPEEPAREDLEEEIDRFEDWLNNFNQSDYPTSYTVRDIARHFAEWQKEKDEQEGKVLFEKSSGDCPKELIDIIDKEFGIDGRDENNNPLNGYGDWQCGMILNGPAISGLVKLGAEWQKQKMKETLQTEYEKGRFDMREEMMKDAIESVSCTYSNMSGTFLHIKEGLNTKDDDKVKIVIVK